MADDSKFQILTVKEDGEVGSQDLTDMVKTIAETDDEVDISGGANKLDRDYAHFKLAADLNTPENPPTLEEGELVYYTRQRLEGSWKITEHIILDDTGEETVVNTQKVLL